MSAVIIDESKMSEKLNAELKIKVSDIEIYEYIKPRLAVIVYVKNKDRVSRKIASNSFAYELLKVKAEHTIITPVTCRTEAITTMLIQNALEVAGYEQTAY